MKPHFYILRVAFFLLLSLFFFSGLYAQVNVLTQHNDLNRTGWNSKEKKLTQANVSPSTFGKLFTRTVDDQIYTQPLIVSNISISGKTRNVVYVATVNNTLYAFDADDVSATTPLWKVSLTPSGYRAVKNTDMTGACGGNYKDFTGNMGTVGTPVIDLSTNTLYVVAHSVLTTNSTTNIQYLHAIDILTGAEKSGSPVSISATVDGTGDGAVLGKLSFNPQRQNQRPGLLLYNNVVYICWASYCDWSPYHGWVIGYDATTLQQKYVYNDTPGGGTGGIWMSGQAPAVDANGFVYVSTGNGTVGGGGNPNDTTERGESILKLSTQSGNLKVVDFFTPHTWPDLEANDLDYGCDGVMLIPNTHLSISGSKAGLVYVVNTDRMYGTTANDTGAKQIIDVNASLPDQKHVHGTPVYYSASSSKGYIYVWGENSLLKQIPFNQANKKFNLNAVKLGSTILPGGMPGAMLALSSNARQAGTGILWASHPLSGDANQGTVPGVVQAFAADDVTHELWNSNQNPTRDGIGNFAKFVCPTVANGKVYMATFSNQLIAYGVLSSGLAAKNSETNMVKSVAPLTNNSKFSIYPNPAHGQVTITYNSSSEKAQQAEILLVNSAGKEVFRQKEIVNLGTNTITLHLPSGIPAGVYLVHLFTGDNFGETRKLTIEK